MKRLLQETFLDSVDIIQNQIYELIHTKEYLLKTCVEQVTSSALTAGHSCLKSPQDYNCLKKPVPAKADYVTLGILLALLYSLWDVRC